MKKNTFRLVLGFVLTVSFFAAADVRTSAGKKDGPESERLTDLTMRIAALSSRLQVAGSESDFARWELRQLAEKRYAKMLEAVEKNPSEVLRVALPKEFLAKMPEDLQGFFEKRDETEGALEVVSECDDKDARTLYFLSDGKEKLKLHFNRQPEVELLTGDRISVRGIRVGDSLAVEDDGTEIKSKESESSALPNTTGEIKVLVMLVNFQNDTRTPYTISQANNLLFNTANSSSVTNYYREASYGQSWIAGDTVGWYTLPMDANCDAISQIATYAKQSAVNAGINLAAYDKYMYVYPQMGCSYSGRGSLGGKDSWINGSLVLRTTAHELGHNFGLSHSSALNCGSQVIGSNCTMMEYGHPVDIMGAGGVTGHFHPYQKERLGWFNNGGLTPVPTVEMSGNYLISGNSVQDTNPKALKILKSTDSYGRKTFYYIEFRRPRGFDSYISNNSNYMNGVLITQNHETNGSNYLLDMTPNGSFVDAALVVNRSFTDPNIGLTVTTLSANDSGAVLNVSFGAVPCFLANPTISITPTETRWLGAGSSASYTVTVTNNNSSNCASNTFSINPSLPVGWTASVASSVLNVTPGSSAATNVQVLSPTGAADGFYSAQIGAINNNSPSSSASVPISLAVYSALSVSASPNQTTYTRNQNVTVSASVTANGSPMAGANVTFTLIKPNERRTVVSTVTSSNGEAAFNYRFNKKNDPPGTYLVSVSANSNGVSGNSMTSFEVR